MNPQTDLQFWLTVAGAFNSECTYPSCYLCNGSLTFKCAWQVAENRTVIQELAEQFFNSLALSEREDQTLCPRDQDSLFDSLGYGLHRKIRNRFLLWNIQRLMHS